MEPAQELLIRGAAAGIFVGLAAVMLRRPWAMARLAGAGFALAAAAHSITQLEGWTNLVGPLAAPAWLLSVVAPGLFFTFVLSLFDDQPRDWPVLMLPPAALLALALTAGVVPAAAIAAWSLHNAAAAALFAAALLVIWRGWRNDLVETRRRLRGAMLAAAGTYGIAVASVQLFELWTVPADYLSPLAATVLLAFAFAALFAFLRTERALFAPIGSHPHRAEALPGRRDDGLQARLEALVGGNRLYRDEGLSIGKLAAQLGVPEYRLRQVINGGLGHRNFAAYINRWRLEEAKAALRDPTQKDVPIATIALDCGFGSLGTFNRAFKADTGVTPSTYRARQG